MTKKFKDPSIKYTSRDFNTIREDLIEHAKRYYPDTFRDFNEASFGALMVDAVAYIGDMLSFYLDYQANESFLTTANEYNNILKHGKALGYRLESAPSSYGIVTLCWLMMLTLLIPRIKQWLLLLTKRPAPRQNMPLKHMEKLFLGDITLELLELATLKDSRGWT